METNKITCRPSSLSIILDVNLRGWKSCNHDKIKLKSYQSITFPHCTDTLLSFSAFVEIQFNLTIAHHLREESKKKLTNSKKSSLKQTFSANLLLYSFFLLVKIPVSTCLQEHFANFETADFSCGLRGSCFCSAFLPGFVQRLQ